MLASASPARLAVLQSAGLSPTVQVSEVDEPAVQRAQEAALGRAMTAEELAGVLAESKATDVATQLADTSHSWLVLGCDSVLLMDGQIYGKPGSADIARQRLRHMSGQAGDLITGHCLIADDGQKVSAVRRTVVRIGTLSEQEIDAYVATGEPLHVAGSFTLDGIGGAFVDSIEGDPSNVIGVSLPTVRRLIAELGVDWFSLLAQPSG